MIFFYRLRIPYIYVVSSQKLALKMVQDCHGTGKTENLNANFSREGKYRELSKNIKNFPPTQEKF